jgi:S1-C subfamily serine protease
MWSGSGIEIERGHIITNYHVVDGASNIIVQRVVNDREEKFVGEVIATDKVNDLAVIKITDTKYYKCGQLPYSVKFTTSDVGESCYALGYPMISTMGTEMKLTTGVISSRSGFQGDVSTYQVSAPVQPGNSGGPLFNYKGELIGIINAKHTNAENVSYAIKTSYVRNLTESFTNVNLFPTANLISGKDLPGQVKSIKPLCSPHTMIPLRFPAVPMIICPAVQHCCRWQNTTKITPIATVSALSGAAARSAVCWAPKRMLHPIVRN